jgi:hypothetical protein
VAGGLVPPTRRTTVDSTKEVESGFIKGAVVGGQDEREEAIDERVPDAFYPYTIRVSHFTNVDDLGKITTAAAT